MLKRLRKTVCSRYFLAVLCILLEFTQLVAVFVLLYEFFLPITILGWIFHVGCLLYLINRHEIPELKLPWLIILFLLPVIGAFVFMLLSSNDTSKKEYARYELSKREILKHLPQNTEIEYLKKEEAAAYTQARYLYSATQMPCSKNTKTIYYPIGEDFHAALLMDLESAQQFVFMEYFIVQEGEMWNSIHEILKRKARSGVSIYVMYDDFGCMFTLPECYYEQLENEGIHCIPSNKFKPVLSHIHNNRDHRKITVIDGRIGYTGGINLADEYINAIVKHGYWKDTAVRLEGEAVRNLMALFLENWNAQSDYRLDCGIFMNMPVPCEPSDSIVIPFGDGPSPIYKESIGKTVYLNMINNAKDYLYITTPYLICDHELMNALQIAAKRGVDVRLIVPHIPDKKTIFLMTRSSYQPLIQSEVRIYEYTSGFIHAKNFVCDDKFAVCGTINLDYRSLVHHFECGTWMYGTECIADMKEDFLNTVAVSEEVNEEKARLRLWERLPAELMKVFTPLL